MNPLDTGLLRLLRHASAHCSPSDLATQLGVTLAEVEKSVGEFRAVGFDIETRPGLGFRLLTSPDRLIADDLGARLPESCQLAREIIVFEETSSTNDVAAQLGRQGHTGNVVIFAEHQTAGRGRFGRRWESKVGCGLWFSVLLRPALPQAQWVRLTTVAGVALSSAVAEVVGIPTQIKWPNDVLVSGRKVAGILLETSTDPAGAPFVVIGMGVNVNHEIDDFPPELRERATSLRWALGQPVDRADLAARILLQLEEWLSRAGNGFDDVLVAARRSSSLLGEWIRLQAGDLSLEGTAESLDTEGNLLLRLADGSLRTMNSGEVTSQGGVGAH